MKYDHQISSHKKHRFLKRSAVLSIVLLLLATIIFGLIRVDSYFRDRKNTPDNTTTRQTTSFYDTKDQIYRTGYFQFQTKNSWVEIQNESSQAKYVYRNLSGSIIEEELVIYVNNIPANLAATRVLPVSLNDKQQFEVGKVSEHCVKSLGGATSSQNQKISLRGVKMLCDSDSTLYEVLVGPKGGTTNLALARPDRTSATYAIFYRNVKATPNPEQLYQIISSFQTR